MHFTIFEYSESSFVFLGPKRFYDEHSQKHILMCNRLMSLCDSGIAKLPLYILISGPPGKKWKMIVMAKSKKDIKCEIPWVIQNGKEVPCVPTKCISVVFEDRSDVVASSRKAVPKQKFRSKVSTMIEECSDKVYYMYFDMSVPPK